MPYVCLNIWLDLWNLVSLIWGFYNYRHSVVIFKLLSSLGCCHHCSLVLFWSCFCYRFFVVVFSWCRHWCYCCFGVDVALLSLYCCYCQVLLLLSVLSQAVTNNDEWWNYSEAWLNAELARLKSYESNLCDCRICVNTI